MPGLVCTCGGAGTFTDKTGQANRYCHRSRVGLASPGSAPHTGHDVRTVSDSKGMLALKAGRPKTHGTCTAAKFTRAKP